MAEAPFTPIKNKIISGVFALSARTVVIQGITWIATFILTVLLSESAYGIFFTVSAAISFISYFSDIGLAAILIQKNDEITKEELESAFTIQFILVGSVSALLFFLAPSVSSVYKFGSEGTFLLRALSLSFFISSLKTISSVLLERKLEFSKLVLPQLIEVVVFYSVTIFLVVRGFSLMGYAYGAVLRSLAGLAAIFFISPWKVQFRVDFRVWKRLVNFGVPFQANSLLAMVKDDLMTLFLGLILTPSQMGYIGWAKKYAEAPLRTVMDNVIRVTFPAFARLQSDKSLLSRAVNKSFFFLGIFIFPSSLILAVIMKPLVFYVPRYIKWEPALGIFYLFVFSSIMASFSSPAINAINAIGRVKLSLVMMVVWTALTWITIPIFVNLFGYQGVAFSAMIISLTSFIPLFILKRFVNVSFFASVSKPFAFSVISAFAGLAITSFGNNLTVIILSALVPAAVYILLVIAFMKNEVVLYLPPPLRKVFFRKAV